MNETGLNREDAINDALDLQTALYGWRSEYLRAAKGFPTQDYEAANRDAKFTNSLKEIISSLPESTLDRMTILLQLSKRVSPKDLLSLWTSEYLHKGEQSKEFKKFFDYSATSIFKPTDQEYESVSGDFRFSPPHQSYSVIAFRMYQELDGRPYTSPQELAYNFSGMLRNKKVLELACGPGWFLHTLGRAGAETTGIELNPPKDNKIGKKLGIHILPGEAEELLRTIPENQYDIVISNNFLDETVLGKDTEKSKRIVGLSNQILRPNGLAIHANQYIKGAPFELLLLCWREAGIGSLSKLSDNELLTYAVANQGKKQAITESYDETLNISLEDLSHLHLKNLQTGVEYQHQYISFRK